MERSGIFYQIEYRHSGEEMLWSEDTEDRVEAEEMFEDAKFTGKCDAIELWQYEYDKPTFEGELLNEKNILNY